MELMNEWGLSREGEKGMNNSRKIRSRGRTQLGGIVSYFGEDKIVTQSLEFELLRGILYVFF